MKANHFYVSTKAALNNLWKNCAFCVTSTKLRTEMRRIPLFFSKILTQSKPQCAIAMFIETLLYMHIHVKQRPRPLDCRRCCRRCHSSLFVFISVLLRKPYIYLPLKPTKSKKIKSNNSWKVLISCTIYIWYSVLSRRTTPKRRTKTGHVICKCFWVRNKTEFDWFLTCMNHLLSDSSKDRYLNKHLCISFFILPYKLLSQLLLKFSIRT